MALALNNTGIVKENMCSQLSMAFQNIFWVTACQTIRPML